MAHRNNHSVVSDMFGKSASAITSYPTSDESFDLQHCVSLLQRSLKKKADLVLDSIEGFSITDEQKKRIALIREHKEFLERSIKKVDACIADILKSALV